MIRKEYFILIIPIVLLFLFISSCAREIIKKSIPEAENGILDLTGWDFKNDGTLKLDGEWELYRGKLLEPQHFSDATDLPDISGYYKVPSIWKDTSLYGSKVGTGFLTLRLLIRKDINTGQMGLKLPKIYSAHK